MTHRDRIADFVRRFPGRDDDEISAALKIRPRQAVNQACRALEKSGLIKRRQLNSGKLGNYPSAHSPPVLSPAIPAHLPAATTMSATDEWFWEGNITAVAANFLADNGWTILSLADTSTKEPGLDVHAKRGDRELKVEVKGYPSASYRDPSRAGEIKRTSPSLQAQHWYSHALLKAVRLRGIDDAVHVAIILPDFPRYRSLFQETSASLEKLAIAMLFVNESGSVEAFGLEV